MCVHLFVAERDQREYGVGEFLIGNGHSGAFPNERDAVADLMRDGVEAEQVSKYYPAVTAEAARDALDFARYVDSYDPAQLAV